jgi:glycosyltransferase involved in cell wall biosynthesis
MAAVDETATTASARVVVVTPVLDDWKSFEQLVAEIEKTGRNAGFRFTIFAIDDGSSILAPNLEVRAERNSVEEVYLIRLVRNLGHQRAIAVGLVEAYRYASDHDFSSIVVMDSDGEDPPADIPALVNALANAADGVAVGVRRQRHDPPHIRLGYAIYKMLYAILCNRVLNFGNFCAISRAALHQLVHTPDIWNHLAASISKLRCRVIGVPHSRGWRYDGTSKMTVQSLVLHGLSALSVYTDVILIRIMFATLILSGLAAFAIAVIIGLYLFTDWPIRGWTSILAGIMFVILVQVLAASLAASFLLLSSRSTIGRIPVHELPVFVQERRRLA